MLQLMETVVLWRGARAVELACLENKCAVYPVPRVRIPPSPPDKLWNFLQRLKIMKEVEKAR